MSEAAQVHQILALMKDVKARSKNAIDEASSTFSSKKDHFSGSLKTYEAFSDDDRDRPENESKNLVTTVDEKLGFISKFMVQGLHLMHGLEATNCHAKASLVLEDAEGVVIKTFPGIPVTALVQWEKQWTAIRVMAGEIPTLDPAQKWTKDDQLNGVYQSETTQRVRTKKMSKPITLHPGTDKHAPQVQLITDDVPVGNWTIRYNSGSYSPLQKSQLLERIDLVISAIKKARACANKQPVVQIEPVSKELVKFILG